MRVLEESASGINFRVFLEQASDGIKRLDQRWKINGYRPQANGFVAAVIS
jgi:hypothetical protein